jgi:hypothetical protein
MEAPSGFLIGFFALEGRHKSGQFTGDQLLHALPAIVPSSYQTGIALEETDADGKKGLYVTWLFGQITARKPVCSSTKVAKSLQSGESPHVGVMEEMQLRANDAGSERRAKRIRLFDIGSRVARTGRHPRCRSLRFACHQ